MPATKLRTSRNVIAALCLLTAHCLTAAAPEWIEAPQTRALPGSDADSGKTWFNTQFTKKRGTFRAMFDSVTDTRNSVSGEFLVGQFRYTYVKPIREEDSQFAYDELVQLVMLDCKEKMSATLDSTYKLNGRVVANKSVADADVLMMQVSGSTTVDDLCAFAHHQSGVH